MDPYNVFILQESWNLFIRVICDNLSSNGQEKLS